LRKGSFFSEQQPDFLLVSYRPLAAFFRTTTRFSIGFLKTLGWFCWFPKDPLLA